MKNLDLNRPRNSPVHDFDGGGREAFVDSLECMNMSSRRQSTRGGVEDSQGKAKHVDGFVGEQEVGFAKYPHGDHQCGDHRPKEHR